MNENKLMKEFILFFASLPEDDFNYYTEYFVHNRIDMNIAGIIDNYKRLDKNYDYIATKAFLRALELRTIFQ